ncbi:MAG TPA: protein kinase [Alphaproteobacteria bacterium]|nr:protein kinase [Alphaproteobacteria bacterium]
MSPTERKQKAGGNKMMLPPFLESEKSLKKLKIKDKIIERRGTTLYKVSNGTKTFALKIAHQASLENDATLQILAEAKLLNDNPNICQGLLVEFGTTQGIDWSLLNWIDGPSATDLGKNLREQKHFQAYEFSKIFMQMAQSLMPAHQLGILHGDLQPTHFLGFENSCKLIDWGLAPSIIAGTYRGGLTHYTAPEVAAQLIDRDEAEYKVTAEIYSLAAVFFTLCNGVVPMNYGIHGNEEPRNTKLEAIAGYRRNHTKTSSNALTRLIEMGLSKNPSERFQSLEDFWGALNALREH